MEENGGTIPDEHHSEVGGAGRERFASATCRRNPQDGANYVNVRNQSNEAGAQDHHKSNHESHRLHGLCTGAGQGNPGCNITEEMIDCMRATEGQGADEGCWHRDGQEATNPGAKSQLC